MKKFRFYKLLGAPIFNNRNNLSMLALYGFWSNYFNLKNSQ